MLQNCKCYSRQFKASNIEAKSICNAFVADENSKHMFLELVVFCFNK